MGAAHRRDVAGLQYVVGMEHDRDVSLGAGELQTTIEVRRDPEVALVAHVPNPRVAERRDHGVGTRLGGGVVDHDRGPIRIGLGDERPECHSEVLEIREERNGHADPQRIRRFCGHRLRSFPCRLP